MGNKPERQQNSNSVNKINSTPSRGPDSPETPPSNQTQPLSVNSSPHSPNVSVTPPTNSDQNTVNPMYSTQNSSPLASSTEINKSFQIVDIPQNFVPMQSGLPPLETNHPSYFAGYGGYLERVEAEQLLTKCPPGTFLIRWSDNKKFYVITYVDTNNKVQHMGNIELGSDVKITRVTKGEQRQYFPSMSSYTEFLMSKKMLSSPFESVAYITGEQYAEKGKDVKTEYEDFEESVI